MNRNLYMCSLLAALTTAASAQNTLDDYPNLPPGAALAMQPNGTASANYATDLDVFTFFVATPATLTVYTTGNTDTNGVLRRPGTSAGTTWSVLATEEGGTGNFRITRQVEPGQYSIQVGGRLSTATAGGEYGLKLELVPLNQPTPADIDLPGAPRGGTVAFGTAAAGTAITRTFTIGNTGGSALNVTSINTYAASDAAVATPLAFAVEGSGARTIAAGSSSTFIVTFRPSQAGESRALLRIVSNDSDENPWDVQLTGNGQVIEPPPPAGPEIAAALGNADLPLGATVSFGLVPVPANGDAVREVIISNRGDADLNLGNVRIELLPLGSPLPSAPEGFFKVLTQPAAVVAPGRSTVIRLGAGMTTAPATTQTRYAASAIFENNDANENPYRLTLIADVQPVTPPGAGEIELAAGGAALSDDGTFDMGTTATGTALTRTFTIKNSGNASLLVSGISVDWAGPVIAIFPPPVLPFIVEGGAARSIAPGASSEFRVIFKSSPSRSKPKPRATSPCPRRKSESPRKTPIFPPAAPSTSAKRPSPSPHAAPFRSATPATAR
jgi:hypothetical protein